MYLPGGSSGKNWPANTGDIRDGALIPKLERSPGEGIGNTLIYLPGKFHGQRSMAGYSPWVAKSQTWQHTHKHIHTHTRRYIFSFVLSLVQ